jgi:asparagine synthase (glutamine-hydrolysing)
MCGITGFFLCGSAASRGDLIGAIKPMVEILRHRGPDRQGNWVGDGIALGHARLAIIDLSAAGDQPMSNDSGSIRVAFNGEIYNFRYLRKELESLGYKFRSHSDTEVIVHGYAAWREEIFSRLHGAFAIALWDQDRQQVVLARDRIGKKPLHFSAREGQLLFGSEIKSILSFPGYERRPNLEAIHHYLTYQYVPAPLTGFQGIEKLAPASYMVISRSGEIRHVRYWSIPSSPVTARRDDADLREELVTLLDDATKCRLISDVPVGAFLSGGVDSSAVVAMMARHATGRIKTFSIGFGEADYDERRFANIVAGRYGTDHHELVVDAKSIKMLQALAWHYDEPFADSSAIPTFCVSMLAKRHVTVALNGDGGDESFLGYERYEHCRTIEHVGRSPEFLKDAARAVRASIKPTWERHLLPRVARRWLGYFGEKRSAQYAPSISYFSDADKAAGYGNLMHDYLQSSSLALLDRYFSNRRPFISEAAWADLHTYLPDDLLVKVDIATMAHGLEARSPFLDHRLIELAARIPVEQKLAGGKLKGLLKLAMEPYLPAEVLYRKKMGFGIPIGDWLMTHWSGFVREVLLDGKFSGRGLFKHDFIEQTIDDHMNGKADRKNQIWAMLMLELWFRTWIDPANIAPAPPKVDWTG